MAAEIFVVGLSHRTAEIELREKLAVADSDLRATLGELSALPSLGEAMVISTCNRVEIHAATPGHPPVPIATAIDDVRSFLARTRDIGLDVLAPHLYHRVGPAAVKHIFRVASSLDSLVIGEPQILGQLKCAYTVAVEADCVGLLLGRCLERSFGVAKRVRSETGIARGSANVSSAAAELARSIFADLHGRRVLLVGAGEMAHLAARHLAADGARDIVVLNRSPERAAELAADIGGRAGSLADLEALLGEVDIVVSSTGSREPIIVREVMKRVMRSRRRRPIFLIDIAVPRDVEHAVGNLDGVYLYDVDDLERVVQGNLDQRRCEVEAAERIVEAETAEFLAWMRQQGIVPTVKELRERFLRVARTEAERTLACQAGGATPFGDDQARLVRQLAETIANRLLHTPLKALRQEDGEEAEALAAATRRLFAIQEDAVPQPTGTPDSALPELPAGRPRP